MSEKISEKLQQTEELSDILLVLDKQKMKIQAVSGIGEDGTLQTVDPIKKNQNQFMRVDRAGDLFSNFFSNFFSQLKNPTHFSFFKVPATEAMHQAREIQKLVDHPSQDTEQAMSDLEVKPLDNVKSENNIDMETSKPSEQNTEYRYQPEQIDWETMANLGLSKDRLEKLNVLEPLLKGYKTNELISISLNLGTAITKMDARLSLQQNDKGEVVVAIHGIRKEPQLYFPFFGHEFTPEDKHNLLTTGNMGRVVELTNLKTGEKSPSIISVDRLTNELVALKVEFIKIPDEIKGVPLSETQKNSLKQGEPLFIEGMTSRKGELFSATVQYNADKRYIEFPSFRNHNKQALDSQTPGIDSSKTFRGKELDDSQYEKFKKGETVYIAGLIDSKGKEYNGYITLNQKTGEADFTFKHPNKFKDQALPSEDYKTQTAVNSEGKTNESTKNIKKSLDPKQQVPKNQKQVVQQRQHNIPQKPKGRKI
ncbi:MAG: DUF3945 domain-containing protein [Chryseobacterium culicis]